MTELTYDVRPQTRTLSDTALGILLLPVLLVVLAVLALREYW